MSKQEAGRLADALESLHDSKAPHAGSPRGQMAGMEDYRLIASGLAFGSMIEAAAKLRRWPDGEPVGYLPAYELSRLQSGHDGLLRSAKLGPSVLDGDVPLYSAPPDQSARIAELESARQVQDAALFVARTDFRELAIRTEQAEAQRDALRATLKQAREALEHLNNVYSGDSDLIINALSAIDKVQP